jgi:hypothetical protein
MVGFDARRRSSAPVERITIEVRDDAADALRASAVANGRSIEEEVGGLVEQTYSKRADDDWVHELIAMTRPGVDFEMPSRMTWERQTPFEFDDFS